MNVTGKYNDTGSGEIRSVFGLLKSRPAKLLSGEVPGASFAISPLGIHMPTLTISADGKHDLQICSDPSLLQEPLQKPSIKCTEIHRQWRNPYWATLKTRAKMADTVPAANDCKVIAVLCNPVAVTRDEVPKMAEIPF